MRKNRMFHPFISSIDSMNLYAFYRISDMI